MKAEGWDLSSPISATTVPTANQQEALRAFATSFNLLMHSASPVHCSPGFTNTLKYSTRSPSIPWIYPLLSQHKGVATSQAFSRRKQNPIFLSPHSRRRKSLIEASTRSESPDGPPVRHQGRHRSSHLSELVEDPRATFLHLHSARHFNHQPLRYPLKVRMPVGMLQMTVCEDTRNHVVLRYNKTCFRL